MTQKKTSSSNLRSARSLSSSNLTSKSVVSSPRSSTKRSRSPSVTLAVERSAEKRRRQREQRKNVVTKLDDDVEQENDDDEIVFNKFDKPKQRQASTGSIEYVQILNNDGQSTPSLNNIENFKSNSNSNDQEILICRSPPSSRKHQSKISVTKTNQTQVII